MVYQMYVIFDRVSGQYGAPIVQVSDACAVRAFKGSLSGQFGFSSDYELYHIGSFDTSTGVVTLCDRRFLLRGEEDEKKA